MIVNAILELIIMDTKIRFFTFSRTIWLLIFSFVLSAGSSFYISSNGFIATQSWQGNHQKFLYTANVSEPKLQKKKIALSFDDGPNGKYTEEVLALLKEKNIIATFFVCGDSTTINPLLVKKAYDMGNEIGNHTYSHVNIAKLSDQALVKELSKSNEEIHKAIGKYPVLFRPPYGASSARANEILAKEGFKKVTWDYMVNDYDIKKTTSEKIAIEVITHAHSGAIIDMHDGGGNREKTIEALPKIIDELKKQNYEFVTVSSIVKVDPYHE